MPTFQQQIEQLTATFTSDLARLMKASIVESVTNAVAAVPAPAAVKVTASVVSVARSRSAKRKAVRTTPVPRLAKESAPKAGTGKKRSPAAIARTSATLLAQITTHPGLRIAQIAKALKTSTKNLKLPVRRLIAQAKIKTKGIKRARTYSPA